MASDPLRSRRLAATAAASSTTSRTAAVSVPAEPYADKLTASAPARPRKLSLSEDRTVARKANRPSAAAAAGLWSRVGGGLDVVQPGENRVLAGLVLLGAVVRYWHIARPSSVVQVRPFPLPRRFPSWPPPPPGESSTDQTPSVHNCSFDEVHFGG